MYRSFYTLNTEPQSGMKHVYYFIFIYSHFPPMIQIIFYIERHLPRGFYIDQACNSDYSPNYQLIMLTLITTSPFALLTYDGNKTG